MTKAQKTSKSETRIACHGMFAIGSGRNEQSL
jgi:hypothetical protein